MDATIKQQREEFLGKAQKLVDLCKTAKQILDTETFQCVDAPKTNDPAPTKNQ